MLRSIGVAAALLAAACWAEAEAQPLQVAMMKSAGACVALTFDDGPDATLTPQLLSILEAKGVHASFFVIGSKAAGLADVVAREDRDGDDVGNHSWDHPELPKLASDAALRELTRTDDVIKQITGHMPAFSRAPYGEMSVRVASLSSRTFVAWSVDTLDWKYPDVERITRVATSEATNGGIILMHDIHPRTIDAVPGVIDGLRAKGFQLVTLSELLSGHCGGTELAYGGSSGEGAPSETAPVVTASANVSAKPSVTSSKSPVVAVLPPPVIAGLPRQASPVSRYSVFDDSN